jgi:hypothetical protein
MIIEWMMWNLRPSEIEALGKEIARNNDEEDSTEVLELVREAYRRQHGEPTF